MVNDIYEHSTTFVLGVVRMRLATFNRDTERWLSGWKSTAFSCVGCKVAAQRLLLGQWRKQTFRDSRREAGPAATSSPTSRSLSSPESWTSVANNTRAHVSGSVGQRVTKLWQSICTKLIIPHQQRNCRAISHTLRPTQLHRFYLQKKISCIWHWWELTDFAAPVVIQCTVAIVLTGCDINITSANSEAITFTVWMGLLNKSHKDMYSGHPLNYNHVQLLLTSTKPHSKYCCNRQTERPQDSPL